VVVVLPAFAGFVVDFAETVVVFVFGFGAFVEWVVVAFGEPCEPLVPWGFALPPAGCVAWPPPCATVGFGACDPCGFAPPPCWAAADAANTKNTIVQERIVRPMSPPASRMRPAYSSQAAYRAPGVL
jgi:hypothetical protein